MQTLSLRIFAAEILLASLTAVVGLSVFVSSPCLLAQSDKNVTTVAVPHSLGIVDEKPASGPAVEVDGKFMVPYSTTIPGTEVEIKMVPIPGGTFLMGASNGDAGDDVTPQVEVAVEPFWMGQHEVNWAQYQSYMAMDAAFKKMAKSGLRIVTSNDELDAVTAPSALYEPDITYEAGEDADQPAASMTQFAAKQFTKWLSLISGQFYRLPYEAEWEYACRAGTTTKYYFGDGDDQLDQHAWHYNASDEQRHACGQLKPNPWGLYDMYGNVGEWCQQIVKDYSDYEGEDRVFETVVTEDKNRTMRGGSFTDLKPTLRSALRTDYDPTYRSINFGLRVARTIEN